MIWRSYDPNGPEIGRLREALLECGLQPGEEAFVLLARDALMVLDSGAGLLAEQPEA